MRSLEQQVTFHLNRLNVAIAATTRAERKIVEAREKKTSALQYANNNIGHVERELAKTNSKLEAARKALGIAEGKEPTAYTSRVNAALSHLFNCETSVTSLTTRVASLRTALIAAEADVSTARESVLTAHDAVIHARNSTAEKSPGFLYAQLQVENFERSITASNVKLSVAKAALVSAEERYESLIDSATTVAESAKIRQNDVQSDYLEAADAVEYQAKLGHAETLRQIKQTNPRPTSRGVASDIEPPEGWAEFDRKANAEILRQNAENQTTN